eukprot:TRINITY_DN1881_c0_g1_i1.p1 TRINITY_DN1881_c0_g1~~TRINITY_DN1881_c0_g1_i1.p1  ORF type:complete len:192 (+),score=22.43 TRINITY_DN1881_c0_g1_i1:174-749(+)
MVRSSSSSWGSRRSVGLLVMMVAVVLAATSITQCAAAATIVPLRDDNFVQQTRGGTVPWLILFCSPWAGHCHRLNDIWTDIAATLEDITHVGMVDPVSSPGVTRQLGVTGYPAMRVIRLGLVYTFEGPYTYERVHEFAHGGYFHLDGVPLAQAKYHRQAKGPPPSDSSGSSGPATHSEATAAAAAAGKDEQ